jgi:hypothetical protein
MRNELFTGAGGLRGSGRTNVLEGGFDPFGI